MGSRFARWIVIGTLAAMGCGNTPQDPGPVETELSLSVSLKRPLVIESRDESGVVATLIDGAAGEALRGDLAEHAFFKSFGTNGRACIHCHVPSAGWTITPETAMLRFTNPLDVRSPACLADPLLCRPERDPERWGLDPLFRSVDGANSPDADVSTADKRFAAFSMLLTKGLIRVGIGIPANAEFTLAAVDDPYHYAGAGELSLFRRPLPATNLAVAGEGNATLSSVMWDGRETLSGATIRGDLADQANQATLGHAQAMHALPEAAQREIVELETHLHTAQLRDRAAGELMRDGARGGPSALAWQPFWPGINDVLGGDPHGATFSPQVFDLYDAWRGSRDEARARVARGQALFNTRTFVIRGVKGLNDALGRDAIEGSCSTCHDSPDYGHHSLPLPLDIGVSDGARRTADLPLYTLRNKQTGETVQTTDPGRALITGKWHDVGKFKGPILRGAAARPPYFHNGSAASLEDVVQFYDQRFAIGLSHEEKRDLVAFLRTL